MKINAQVLSLPPYISTSWKNINSLTVDTSGNLIILLHSNAKIIIPNLEKSIINLIFDAHAKHIEKSENSEKKPTDIFGSPFLKIGPEGIDSLGSAMQHNQDQKDAPDLPNEILDKIKSITKIMGIESPDMAPKPEENCNCVHCQIARAIRGLKKDDDLEDEVTEDDLKFRTWDIEQTDEKLYTLTNPLDKNEHYTVFLGSPIGCTCGEKNCEHIKAVLNS